MKHQFYHPFSVIVAGPSGCVKSYFVLKFLKNASRMCNTNFEKVLWFYDEWQPLYKDLSEIVEFQQGLPDMRLFDGGSPNLIIIDDLMRESNADVVDIFTKGCHHRNLSIFFITQNIFHLGKGQRDIFLNAHYIICFKNPRDGAQIRHQARQICPEDSKFLQEAYPTPPIQQGQTAAKTKYRDVIISRRKFVECCSDCSVFPEARRNRLENDFLRKTISESVESYAQYKNKVSVETFEDLKFKIDNFKVPDKWIIMKHEKRVNFLLICNPENPKLQCSVGINEDLSVFVFVENVKLTSIGNLKLPEYINDMNVIDKLLSDINQEISEREDSGMCIQVILSYCDRIQELLPDCKNNVEFIKEQVKLLPVHKSRLRYSWDLMLFCSLLHSISPHAYRFLRSSQKLKIPSTSRIRQVCGKFSCNPQLEQNPKDLLRYVSSKFSLLSAEDKLVILLMDEIHLKENLDYESGNIVGNAFNDEKLAKSAHVFMISSLISPYKEVVHILPVNKMTGEVLHTFLKNIVIGLHNIGFEVLGVVSDNHSINRKAISYFSNPPEVKIVYPNPADENKSLYFVIDTVHILKNINTHIQTNNLEERFGKYRQLARSQYHVSVRQIFESEAKLRRQAVMPLALTSHNFGEIIFDVNCVDGGSLPSQEENAECNVPDILANNCMVDVDDLDEISDTMWPLLTYIGGYCSHQITKKLKCNYCVEFLKGSNSENTRLIAARDRGGLSYPHEDVVRIVASVYIIFQKLISSPIEHVFVKQINQRATVISLGMENIPDHVFIDAKERLALIKSVGDTEIHCVCECVYNTLKGKVPLSTKQKAKLARHKSILRKLVKPGESIKKKKRLLLQKSGTFLPLILTPILSSMLEAMKEIVNNSEELERWIKMANSNVRLLNAALKKCKLSLGTKRHVESSIARMKGYGAIMKARLQEGAGRNTFRQRRKERLRWDELNSAFQGKIRTGVIINLKHTDPLTFLEDAFSMLKIRVQNILKNFQQIKVNTVFCGLFENETGDSTIEEIKYFQSKNAVIDGETNLKDWWEEYVQDDLIVQREDFQERESGWSLKSVVNLAININRYEPIRGSFYVPLPSEIAKKRAVVNVKNNDDACFAWAVTLALHPAAKNSDRVSSYQHYSAILNLDNITFPMTMNQLKKFEKQNQISINVFMLEKTNKGF
ncbi:hypothetical protein ILUMI_19947 [Ignelater luminosus]|uniref:Transposable element P transposase-like RNase H domain-containing protein n=1 Tax=Ignelater luminosus TaxID=2038154 RepID=A0A8K0CJG0_IGNLU|nr:hypothetical protein ILUMI_19947 [Ignelater luminosus]